MCLAQAACQPSEVEPLDNPVPIVEVLDPTSVTSGAGTSITVRGLGFVEGSQARWNAEARPTTVVDDRHLTMSLSADDLLASATEIDVVNSPPGGGTSEPVALIVISPPPTLSSISPTSAPAIVTPEVRIDAVGADFVSGPGGSVLHWDGAPLATTVSSATTLSAVVPDYLLRVGRSAAITVRNGPSQAESEARTFEVQNPIPSIAGFVPAGFPLGSGGQLEVTGSDFVPGASVLIENTRLSPLQSSASQLIVAVPASVAVDPGTVALSIENPGPGGGTSNVVALSIWASPPSVDYLMPSQALAGAQMLTLVIVGDGFEASSSLTWNGTARTSTVVNAQRIEVTVSAADLTNPDTARIIITNPSDGAQAVALFPIVTALDLLVVEPWGLIGSLVTSRLDGTEQRTFTPGNGATRVDASPIGPFAVYHDNGQRIYEIDLISGASRRVTPVSIQSTLQTESWARYSSDGAWIFFTGEANSAYTEIWRARTDGSVVEVVTAEAGAWLRFASPSRDGSRVVYSRGENPNPAAGPLWVYDLATSTPTSLGVEGLTSRWSPLDTWLVYLTDTWDLRAIRPDGTGDFALVTSTDVGHTFDFSPDGSFLVSTTQSGEPIRISFPAGQVSPLPGLPAIGSIAWVGP
jgi:hypothetical protein